MAKMWEGRTLAVTDKKADDFNSSISFDSVMFREDIKGSMAHAAMLAACGILKEEESEAIIAGLEGILCDLESGKLAIDYEAEDIHMFVEATLTARIGDVGKKLHTARSRNDQVALDTRLYLRRKAEELRALMVRLVDVVCRLCEENKETVMPGYTHLQRAQPITFAQHLLAYAMMFMRDISRLDDAKARMNESPLGSAALAGTTYPIDRHMTAKALGFNGPTQNSIDGVSDRDFCVELLSVCSLFMAHLSRFAEEVILWCSWEFRFVELSDAYTTGSSIMPQKKNADMAELVRGKTGRVYGDLQTMLVILKGLPLAYNKDMQEDKEATFDGIDTAILCADIFASMLDTMKAIPENMFAAAQKGFLNATDLADYLTKKGMPFRDAYKLTGSLVRECIAKGTVLDSLTLADYKEKSELFEADLFEAIDIKNCVRRRISFGGTGFDSVQNQIDFVKAFLASQKGNA